MSNMYINRCCDPLNVTKHSTNLRLVTEAVRARFSFLNEKYKICDSCRQKIDEKIKSEKEMSIHDYVEIVSNIQQKFDDENISKKEKLLLIKILPKNWSVRKLSEFSKSSRWLSAKSKVLENEHDSLDKRGGARISKDTTDTVKLFYENDDNSRIMPGYKDNKCVKTEDGTKTYIQKRLILYNLRKLFLKFKDQEPDIKIGFTKFAELRPPYCVLAGSSGTHSVCVCVHHQNVKLMLAGLKNSGASFEKMYNYKDCIAEIVCKDPTSDCYLNKCTNCPGIEPLKLNLQSFLEDAAIPEIKFQIWQTTDRSTLQTLTVTSETFIDKFFSLLYKLKTHSFISKQQSSHFQTLRESLSDGQFLISLDFSENYAFVAQDAAQSFHYNNNQCSLATAVIYYKGLDSTIQHKSIVVFSDNLTHDTAAVYRVQEIMINFLKSVFDPVRKVFYFTDGAAQHFKNKYNFHNLANHYEDFSVQAEWHFHATAHGKNACDGIGASVKSSARRASLQNVSDNYILTSVQLYDWAKQYFKNITCFYTSKDEYLATLERLKERFSSAKTIPGTQSFHCVQVLADTTRLELKVFSKSETSELFPPIKRGRSAQNVVEKKTVAKRSIQSNTLNDKGNKKTKK